jgi:serine protease Do
MLRAFTILGLILSFWAVRSSADTGDIQTASRSVVRIAVFVTTPDGQSLTGHGSGIVVAPNMILTNAHVVEEPELEGELTFVIVPSEGKTNHPARVIKVNSEVDLALLQFDDGAKLAPAKFFPGKIVDGGDVIAIGYPSSVDIALEQQDSDTLNPQSPVKTRGTVSNGRSGKNVETILHTAPIGPGNSGGPLTDTCGRIIGVNSFGTLNEAGGAKFFFAVSMREITAFLADTKVKLRSDSTPCTTAAERDQAKANSADNARAKSDAAKRIASELKSSEEGKVRRSAEFAIIAERDSGMAISGILMMLSLVAGAATYIGFDKNKRMPMLVSAGIMAVLILLAAYVFQARPSFDQVDARVRALLAQSAVPD